MRFKTFSYIILVCSVMLLSLSSIYSLNTPSTGYQTTSSFQEIDVHSECREVRHTASNSYFAPTLTAYEWLQFRLNAPVDVELQSCSSYDSYCWLKDDKSSCESNFVVDGCGSGTVLDGGTGLCWQRDMSSGGTRTWSNSQSYCSGLSLGGHSDWYLPSKEELMTLTDLSRSNPAIVGGNNIFTNFTNVESNYYWTDTSGGSSSPSSDAWAVSFGDGSDFTTGKTATFYAACVRRN